MSQILEERTTAQPGSRRPGFRAWWATLGAWAPTRAALAGWEASLRPMLLEEINGLIEELLRQGTSPRPTLKHGLPAALRALTLEQLRPGLEFAARLAARGLDPAPVLEHALPVVAQGGGTPEVLAEGLEVLEELILRLADERRLRWDLLAGDLARLTREALHFRRQNTPYTVAVAPERLNRVVIADMVPSFDLPLLSEVAFVDAPQRVDLLPVQGARVAS